MAGKGPGKRAWGKVAPAKNVSLLSVMSEQVYVVFRGVLASPHVTSWAEILLPQLATNLQTQPSKYTAKPHILAELKSMGFSQERIDTAAMKTGYKNTTKGKERKREEERVGGKKQNYHAREENCGRKERRLTEIRIREVADFWERSPV
eukprot:1334775-Amorphochlora_amoeboformis.AAC.1